MARKHAQTVVAVLVLLLTASVFTLFFIQNPQYFDQLKEISPWVVVAIVALYGVMTVLLVGVYQFTLRLCGKRLELRENFLLTAYSSIVNFFGPLQSGPGVRAVYLKARHQVRLRDYTLATLIYYALFAFFSAVFLLAGNRPWWQTLLAGLAVAGFSSFVIRWFIRRDKSPSNSQFHLRGRVLFALTVVTFLQVALTAIIYFVELRAINPDIGLGQAISYAGAANFALFVSLTPGAIGFREAFLVFSQNLHHVSTGDIFAASLIDRGSYVIFLAILAVIVAATHAKDKLKLSSLRRS